MLFANNITKGRKIIQRNKMIHEQIKLHFVVSMGIFNIPYYEETCLKEVFIWMVLERTKIFVWK